MIHPARPARHGARRQRGAVTLLMALSVLVLITIMTLISSEIYTVEQRIAGNELRQRQALAAAMTGYEQAMAYISDNGSPDADGNGTADAIAAPDSNPTSRTQITPSGNGNYAVEFCSPDVATNALPASPTATCTAATYAENQFKRVLIYARGWSDDNTAVRHIVAIAAKTPGLADAPGNPLTTQGTAIINGSGDITNPEGRSTVWAGQTVEFTNANFKTNILSPDGAGIVETSNRDTFGPDVVQNDGNLSTMTGDEFFASFFGSTPAVYKSSYVTDLFNGVDIGSHDGAVGEIMWSEGATSTTGNLTFGSAVDPVILIINGDFTTGGNVTVNGLLYVIGDMSGTGNTTVNGAVVVQGGAQNITGSFDVVFNSSLLGGLDKVGQATLSPGSWKDWKEW